MSEHTSGRHGTSSLDWSTLPPVDVLKLLVQELYNPVSLLGSHLNRLTGDDDPISEEEYEEIFAQMDKAVGRLSKVVVQLRRYVQEQQDAEQNP